MEINKVPKLDVSIYHEQLDNGLNIYVVPLANRNNIYVTLTTKFGSRVTEFVPNNQSKMTKVPYGVAHFLEHKVFEQKDGIDPFTFFSERGANANANTSFEKTTYLFSGASFLEENINYLLDYVQEPYFTDENVEKEKGIIVSECQMYKDRPYSRCYEQLLANAFKEDGIKVPVIGTVESINSITKEDLYACYNTFYHPSNMFIVVTGNVEPEKIINTIKKNQEKKEFKKFNPIKTKKIVEQKGVVKKEETITMDITIPKIMIGYKIDLKRFNNVERRKLKDYLSIIFDINFGNTSIINQELIDKQIINGDITVDGINLEDYTLIMITAESNDYKEFEKQVDRVIKNLVVTKEEIERKKKAHIGNIVALSNDIYLLNNKIISNMIKYGKVLYDDYEYITTFNIEEAIEIVQKLDLSEKTVCIVKQKEEK